MLKHQEIPVFLKKFSYYLIAFTVSLSLYACPFSSVYKLDNESTIPVNDALLGNWITMVQDDLGIQRPVRITLAKRTDLEYDLILTGKFNDLKAFNVVQKDSIKAIVFMSIVNNRQFLNIEIKGQTYIVELIFKNNLISLLPLADGFTSKYIKSGSQLRKALEFYLRTRVSPRYDEQFCLKEMVKLN
jgi:hypothetical protein